MRRVCTSFAVLTAVSLLLGWPAFAQDKPAEKPAEKPAAKPDKPTAKDDNKTEAKKDHAKPADVASAMQDAKLTLAQAVTEAEAHSKGKAIGAWGDLHDKHAMVTVHCVVGEKCMAVTIDHTGKATSVKEADAAHEKPVHNGTGAEVWAAMETASMTLARALQAEDEHHKGATIVAATGKFHGKRPEVYFTSVQGGKVLKSETDKTWKVRDLKEHDTTDRIPVEKGAPKDGKPTDVKKP